MDDSSSLSVAGKVLKARLAGELFGEPQASVTIGRYQLLHRLGEGGMGVVFEARECHSGEHVAIKLLHSRTFEALQLLKREYRMLAGLQHRNLVRFRELGQERHDAFLAMELVHGQRVFDYVRPHDQLDVVRLESVLTQLISAVTFLHAHGVIHRDLKPSNLLVENTGRLVVLDFGLARAIDDPSLGSSSGTHRYMSPERLRGQPANEASDWYSVGVILADMLSGSADDPSPHVVLASVATDSSTPAYLTQLCAQLISAGTPQRGPDTGKLLPPIARGLLPETVAASPFVGRAAELAALWRALQRVQEGNASVVLVHGEPGVGKTALARKFLRDVEHAGCAHVLTSRCHEAELIPYNAIDGLLDALAQHLQELAPERNELLESLAASELSTLFPALGAVLGVPAAEVPSNAQRHLVRERAFARFRELLDALSKSLPLVIHIDDIQWGDADSGKLLAALLEPPAPRVLIVAGFRTASGMSNPCVQTLRAVEVAQRGWVQELALHSFDELTSLELARVLVDPQSEARDLTIISRESGGNPLLLNALAQWHVRGGTRQAQPTLADLIDCVVIDLCALARELLKLIALAGRPLAHDVLARGVDGASTDEIEQQLVDLAHLGLTRNARGAARAVECYHDRIREIVVAGIPHQERQQLHAKLAAAAAAFEEPDSEFLALHYAGASALQEAAKHAQLAADHAFKTLAPEAAAELYLLALRCLEPAGPAALVEKAADALSFAGRCAEAAQLYLRTAEQSERHAAVRQQLRASQLLFHCGNLDQADAVTERLLAAIHIRVPASRWRKLLAIQLAVLRLRSGLLLAPKRRRGSDLERLRADVCFAIGHTLATVDPARACLLIVQVLPSALREDADGRRARALAVYASLLSTLDSGTQRVQDELLAQALTLAKRSDDPEVLVWVRFSQAVTFIARSNFHRGLQIVEQLLRELPDGLVDNGWLRDELTVGCCQHLFLIGRISELEDRARGLEQRAAVTGNSFHLHAARVCGSLPLIAADRPEQFRELVLHELAQPSGTLAAQLEGLTIWAHFCELLYSGEYQAAWDAWPKFWPRFQAVGLTQVEPWTSGLCLLRGTVALAQTRVVGLKAHEAEIGRCIARLLTRKVPLAHAGHRLLEAGLVHARGETSAAALKYRDAADAFEELGMLGFASAARLRQAELSVGDAARLAQSSANRWFERQHVVNPRCWARMYAPIGH